jgi:hypothetical protein
MDEFANAIAQYATLNSYQPRDGTRVVFPQPLT